MVMKFLIGFLLLVAAFGVVFAEEFPIENGETLFYERVGDGDEFIFVISHAYTFPALRALEDDRWTIIAFDPRGRGRSSFFDDDAKLGIVKDLEDIEALRAHFGADKINVLGFSFGGWISTAYASRYAQHVDRLGLLAPGPVSFEHNYTDPNHARTPFPDEANAVFRRLDELRSRGVHASDPQAYCYEERALWLLIWSSGDRRSADFLDYIQKLCRPEYLNEWPITRELRTATENESGNAILTRDDILAEDGFFDRLTAPTLIIHGDEDKNSPLGGSHYWAWRLPNARLLEIDDRAHTLHLEETQRIVEAFRAFFGDTWPDKSISVTESPLEQ